jgi:erythrocyte band 7 integral membrane protein
MRAVNTLGSCIGTLGAIPCCVICPNPYKPVSQGNVGLVTKFGRFYRAVDPGLVKINPLSERLIQVDVKIQIVGMYICHHGAMAETNLVYRGS